MGPTVLCRCEGADEFCYRPLLSLMAREKENRRYRTILREWYSLNFDPGTDIVIDSNGLFSWSGSNLALERWAAEYFALRNEDCVGSVAATDYTTCHLDLPCYICSPVFTTMLRFSLSSWLTTSHWASSALCLMLIHISILLSPRRSLRFVKCGQSHRGHLLRAPNVEGDSKPFEKFRASEVYERYGLGANS